MVGTGAASQLLLWRLCSGTGLWWKRQGLQFKMPHAACLGCRCAPGIQSAHTSTSLGKGMLELGWIPYGRAVVRFMLFSNSYSEQVFWAISGRQTECYVVVFPYLLAPVGWCFLYGCLLLLLFCFCFLSWLFFSLPCVCSSFKIKIERRYAGAQEQCGSNRPRLIKLLNLGMSSVGKKQ